MPSRTRRTVFSLAVFFTACGIAGMVVSQRVGAQSSSDESQFRDSLKSFTSVYDVVAQNYAEPLDGDKQDRAIYDGAIPGMLRVLDPHSNFYDPKAYARMKEDQHGKYYGVGMTIQPQSVSGVQRIVVLYPYEGTPSFKAGVRPGDVIVSVDGKATDNMNSEQVANMLKGPKGTHVHLTVSREGANAALTFDLVRDEIPHPSIDLKEEIRPGIGYIHITQFQESTGREVGDALDSFGPGIKGLVLDLRGNPGGLLNEAVATCDKFLNKGQLIVSQRGRAFPEQSYHAMHGNGGKTYPIVILVNHGTASAAEIVSGAMQDHDRAIVVGETTFGKGLVQTVYPLSDNTGLALTTYHYFTPSGRLIQRNYSGVSLYDYYYNHDQIQQDSKDREVKLTDSGRTVYGGGGITPDYKVDTPKSTHIQEVLLAHYAFFNFAGHYLANRTVTKDFQVDDGVMADFKQFLGSQQITYSDQELNAVMDWVKANIKAEIFTTQFGQAEGLKVRAAWDPMINQALGYMPQATTLEQTAMKTDSQKTTTARNTATVPATE
ncbi:S41 family peptidase [Acidobacterium sp. S8]|uniref:S41 family peptidase n=1 Tax=Acidobacterium sp. S8 TaxID=1641854 RepID=UPI00131E9723|nr:S41 family peptidase [Acidobacterium sp. S8]